MRTLKSIGEFGLIREIARSLKTGSPVVKGIGDDCAVMNFSRKEYLLATVDMLVEDVHFRRRDPASLIGRKALAVSLSDIAAMGGYPSACLVSAGLPSGLKLDYAHGIFSGIKSLAQRYGVSIIGGDTNSSSKIVLDVTCLGMVEKKNLLLRSGARKGDAVMVSGSLGGSIHGRHLRFEPRLKEARFLAENFSIHSMIDVSDGLLQDLGHITECSGFGAVIYEKMIPVSPAAGSLRDALEMGEDYELLFTCSFNDARRIVRRGKRKFSVIGEIVDKGKGLAMIGEDGLKRKVSPRGFRHF